MTPSGEKRTLVPVEPPRLHHIRSKIGKYMSHGWTLALGIIYLATFHLWMHLDRPAIIASTLVVTVLSATLLVVANKRSYFVNAWDKLFHASVAADIFAEGLLIPVHDDYGFYLCALGFCVVIIGYRWRQFRCLSR